MNDFEEIQVTQPVELVSERTLRFFEIGESILAHLQGEDAATSNPN